jgi:hypothetical protein
MFRLVGALFLALFVQASTVFAQATDYESLLAWDNLPLSKAGITAGLASSYDRNGGNDDFNQYESPTGLQTTDVATVDATLTGPGILTRFWMPHATADSAIPIRITVDGVVRIVSNSDALLNGSYGYMQSPLVKTLLGGQVSYEPIAFQNSLKIESFNYAAGGWAKTHNYYQFSYQLLPSSASVTPYTGSLTSAQQADRSAVATMLSSVGEHPAGASSTSSQLAQSSQSIPASGVLSLGSLSGSGEIRRLNVKMSGASDADLDGLRIRVRYDGRSDYAVDMPVSQFFGAGHQRVAYKSLPMGTDSPDGFYCYWPMPYRNGAVVELVNTTCSVIHIDSSVVEYENKTVPASAGYLHAVYRSETTTAGQSTYSLLNVSGEGHYVGNRLCLRRSGTSRTILEGDDIITVDGVHTLYGTGMEDAYNGGYYYNHILNNSTDGDIPAPESGIGPYSGLLHMDDKDFGDASFLADQYRWLIGDFVPFTSGINVKIENYGNAAGVGFDSTAFYYLLPVSGDANFDDRVDVADLGLLATNYGASSDATWMMGDFSGDGRVNVIDLGLLATGYGTGVAMTPEPACMGILLAGIPAVFRRK